MQQGGGTEDLQVQGGLFKKMVEPFLTGIHRIVSNSVSSESPPLGLAKEEMSGSGDMKRHEQGSWSNNTGEGKIRKFGPASQRYVTKSLSSTSILKVEEGDPYLGTVINLQLKNNSFATERLTP